MFAPLYHYLLAVSGNIFYRFPGRKLICIGVTGTNGKSTTVELVNSILKTAGKKTGMLSTIAIEVAEKRTENVTSRTTLGRWQTPRMLRQMVKAGCEYAVVEVASEGIVQFRTWGIPFDVAVFTNLSPEHLNTHGTMRNYRNAKGTLFANLSMGAKKKKVCGKRIKPKKISIVNADDKEAGYFSAFPADESYLYGIKRGDIRATQTKLSNGLEFTVEAVGKRYPVKSKLLGGVNVYNILAAWCVGFSQNISPKKIAEGIFAVKQIEGRMEKVGERNGVQYFLDYAMTPDSYEILISELKKIASGRVILVFGAAGDRDRRKRPQIGAVAAKRADFSILTDDEPYSEDPKEIVREIEAGFRETGKNNYKIVRDRKKAFVEAVRMAKSGDVVVGIGMGHEKFRNIGGNKKIPWDEAGIIKNLLK